VEYYAGMGRPYQLLMFPEGTDRTEYTMARSDDYAKREGLRPLRQLLQPRTAGFLHLVRKMRESGSFLRAFFPLLLIFPLASQRAIWRPSTT
jgi:lysocardiolipin and lysophospholipid acyltransferase